jgi:uncharacterized protein YegL
MKNLYATCSLFREIGSPEMKPNTKRKAQLLIALLIFCLAGVASYFSVAGMRGKKYDVYLVLDISGSMGDPTEQGGQSKLDATKLASTEFLRAIYLGQNPNIRVGLITFSQDVYLESPLTSDKNYLIGKINGLHPITSTSVGDAIQKGVDMLVQEGGASANWTIIVMTDGNSNADHVVCNDPHIAPLLAAEHANQSHIVVDAVAFGSDANLSMCQGIAQRGGGQFLLASTGRDLASAFLEIAKSLVSPIMHYGARILMLISIPLILFLPELEKGASTMIRTFSTTILKRKPEMMGIKCPECGRLNRLDAKFCGSCRAPLVVVSKKCPRCGYSNRSGARFCANCRFDIRELEEDSR